MTNTAYLANELESNSVENNRTQRLKDIFEKVTSITIEEVDIIKAVLSINRSLG